MVSESTVSNAELSEFFLPSPSSGERASEFLSAYYLCDKANSPSFSQNSPSLPQNSVRLSEFSSPKQYSRNSIPPVSYITWSRRYAERIWGDFFFWSGEFQENCRRISQRILMANFDSEFVGLVFQGFQATQKIHTQNSRPELSAFLSNFTFLNPKFIHGDFLLTGETNITDVDQVLTHIFDNK